MTQCWALTDYRPGTANQVLGIARHTGFIVTEKKLHYSRLSHLPNFTMIGNGLRALTKTSRQSMVQPWPDVVIAAGRRSAPVSVALKRRNPAMKIVHLMKPEWSLGAFDMVMIPAHDQPPDAENIVTTLGAAHCLTEDTLFAARARHPLNPELLPRPWTLLCLGGSTQAGNFMLSDIEALIRDSAPLLGSGSLLLTGSRRTTNALAHCALDKIKASYPSMKIESYFSDQGTENPYHAWLAQADRIIVTADSVSMISEAAFSGKAVYVFTTEQAASPKHLRFVDAMVQADHIKPLDAYDPLWQSGLRLNEAARLGKMVRELVLNN